MLDLEVIQVLRRYLHHHILSNHRASQAMDDFLDFPLTRYPHQPLLARILELRENVTSYDAAYVSLAEVLNIPLITCDAKLATAPGHTANMVLV